MVTELATFAGVSAVVIMTPGPDTAPTIRNTLLGGRRTGIATALGVSLGQAVWTLAASAGIAALLVASEPAFRVIKLLGAARTCSTCSGPSCPRPQNRLNTLASTPATPTPRSTT